MNENVVVVAIDDDAVILNGIVSVFKDECKVRPFTSAETALKFLEKNDADIILLDCNMPPNMNGFQALELFKQDEKIKKIPVIFLTGETDAQAEAKALVMGAWDYLRKPFEPISLLTRVKLQLELTEYQNSLETKVLEKTEELQKTFYLLKERDEIMLDMLAELSDLRDHDTGLHILRTEYYSKIIVDYILANPRPGYEITQQQRNDIVKAVKLHDLGKISIPDAVLLKPGRLTPEEFEVIKTHTTEGAKMLEKAMKHFGGEGDTLFLTAYDIAYEHHEKFNGAGYPRGISGENIKLSARITAVADVFDALTSERPYKRPFPVQEALDIIYHDSGTHFDPYLVEIVRLHEKEFTDISEKYR